MLLSGEPISAIEAREFGMVHQVVECNDLDSAAHKCANQLARQSVSANAAIKRAAIEGADLELDAGLELERELAVSHMTGPDPQIGLRAFRERTSPLFTGLEESEPS
jgi:enoyl-CoA hydratase/carnithine racemase